jgi:hypothetical protein
MAELARLRKQWEVAAAERAACLDSVKRQALDFLEAGKLPYSITAKNNGPSTITFRPDWPLLMPDYLLPLLRNGDQSPHYDILIDMAIAERHSDEILRWFDLWRTAAKSPRGLVLRLR